MNLRWVHVAAFVVVIVGWLLFAALFLFHKQPPPEKATRRDRRSIFGIVVQGVGYAAVWTLQRPRFTPVVPLPGALQVIPAVIVVVLTIYATRLSMTALRTLGKEWSFSARLVEGHRLVTEGPYHLVRHPIYSAMLANLVATGLALSHWIGLLGGIVIFGIGTAIRVKSEERLLRAQFGPEYEDYARRVPAIVPRFAR
jgi:protein-S-isoprenylcysteine O-methyltransferase Ste14